MQTVDIATGGMHCSSCTMLIEMSVGELAGVQCVKADLEKERTHVEFDPTAVSVDAILGAIRDAGHDAELIA
jgi:copper ion binding protein